MSVFANVLAAGLTAVRGIAGGQVRFKSGDKYCDVVAARGRSSADGDNEFDMLDTFQSDDFLIAAADLLLYDPGDDSIETEPHEPQRGDSIDVVAGDKTFTYEVNLQGNAKPWRWSDPETMTELRIHTKLVSVA